MPGGHFIQVSGLIVRSKVLEGQKGECPLRVAVRKELLVFVTCWRENEKEFVAARCTNASNVPFIISLLNLPSEANPQMPDSEVYFLQAAVSVSLSIVSSLLHFRQLANFVWSLWGCTQLSYRHVVEMKTRLNPEQREERDVRVDLTSLQVTEDSFLCWETLLRVVSQFSVCILQRSIWESQRCTKAVSIQRLLQMLLLLPVFWRMHRNDPSWPHISQDSLHARKRRKKERKWGHCVA